MTLLLGLPEDPPLAAVHSALLARGASCLLVDQGEIERFTVELHTGATLDGAIVCEGTVIPLQELQSVYLRPYNLRREDAGPSVGRPLTVEEALLLWADSAAPIAVNRPSAMASNASKPYQLDLIRRHGFSVPETMLTTEPEFVREFWQQHGRIIYKSMSGVRSIVAQLTRERESTLEDVASCPTQFQRYIAGVEHRVHVVGERVFACRIVSEADDYRYSSGTAMVECELPREIQQRCAALAHDFGLLVAGIDLRRSAEGEWFCFEVNPSPGFTAFELGRDGLIADAISALLAEERKPRTPTNEPKISAG
jgi:hypothetical protein